MSDRSERQVQALKLAQACCELGARARTIHHLTGLSTPELQRLFFADAGLAPRGRAPDSPEWYHAANLLNRAEASIFVAIYRRLRAGGFAAAESLVAAYRQYREYCQAPYRITFDRAFDLASHVSGIWVAKGAALAVVACPACSGEYIGSPGGAASAPEHCPFCRLLQRYACDKRLQASFPFKSLADTRGLQAAVAAMVLEPAGRLQPDAENHSNRRPLFGDTGCAGFKNGHCSS